MVVKDIEGLLRLEELRLRIIRGSHEVLAPGREQGTIYSLLLVGDKVQYIVEEGRGEKHKRRSSRGDTTRRLMEEGRGEVVSDKLVPNVVRFLYEQVENYFNENKNLDAIWLFEYKCGDSLKNFWLAREGSSIIVKEVNRAEGREIEIIDHRDLGEFSTNIGLGELADSAYEGIKGHFNPSLPN